MNNLLDRLLEKTAIVTDNTSGHNYGVPGSTFVIKHITAAGHIRGIPTGHVVLGNNISFREIDINPKELLGIASDGFSLVPSKKIEYDQFQNTAAIEIRDEATIYLSASLRARLDVNPGDKIVVATEKDKKGKPKYFIAKDSKEGTELKEDFTINSHSYVKALGIDMPQSILFVSPVPMYNEDHPDFTFYPIGTRAYEPYKVMDIFNQVEFDPLYPGYLKKKVTPSEEVVKEAKKTLPKFKVTKASSEPSTYNYEDPLKIKVDEFEMRDDTEAVSMIKKKIDSI